MYNKARAILHFRRFRGFLEDLVQKSKSSTETTNQEKWNNMATMSIQVMFENSSTEAPPNTVSSDDDSLTKDISLFVQSITAFIGFIGNIIVFFTLSKNKQLFSATMLKLMKNQAVADAMVCLIGAIIVLQTPMWKTGWSEVLDELICNVRKVHAYCFGTLFFAQCDVDYLADVAIFF